MSPGLPPRRTEEVDVTSRERLAAALRHRAPDAVPVDFGATAVTGIHASAVHRLRQDLLGRSEPPVRVIEPYQMLGEVDAELRAAIGVDVVGLMPRRTMFGFENRDWTPFTLFDGTPVQVPGDFRVSRDPNGDLLIHPEGDPTAPPSGRMPAGGYFFDAIIRQPPIDEDRLDPADNLEEFSLFSEDDLAWYERRIGEVGAGGEGVILTMPGTAFGDIALVPAPWLKHPRGIRDVAEWYVSLETRRDYVHRVFERQCEIGLRNIDRLAERLGDRVDAVMLTGTDFGTQRGLFLSPETYRELFLPYHRAINRRVHERTRWKTFIHSCGSVIDLIPDFVEAGFDILNPVQCSAAKMDPRTLKREFGPHLVFWGGGVDTQRTLPFGTPEEVYREVRERIEIFGEGGGFVFNTVHNVQGNTPTENLQAMFRALRDARGTR